MSINAMNMLKNEEQALSRRAIESALNGNTQISCALKLPGLIEDLLRI